MPKGFRKYVVAATCLSQIASFVQRKYVNFMNAGVLYNWDTVTDLQR